MNIVIVGGGLVGGTLAGRLSQDGHDVSLIEGDSAKVRELTEALDVQVIHGNGATAPMLRRAGVKNASLLLATTESDETNMVVGLLGASLFQVPRVVVRLRDNDHEEGFALINRDHQIEHVRVNPDAATVERIFSLLQVPGAVDVVSFMDSHLLIAGFRIPPSSDFAGLIVSHMTLLFPDTPTLVAAVHRGDDWIIPHGEEEIQAGDVIYFSIAREELGNVLTLVGSRPQKRQHIMIAGAGRIGIELARRLEKAGVKGVLIEGNAELARRASEQLEKVVVVHGPVTDQNLLEEEDIERVSTFVAVTADHEVNLVASLLAKRLGATRTFALVDNPALANMIGDIGIDAVISPRLLAVGLTLQHIRRGRVRASAALLEDKVEVVEAEAETRSPLTAGTLAEIQLPRGVLVIAARRGRQLLVPRGGDRIAPGDQVLFITTTERARELDAYLST